jgi:beta-lactamase class A
MKEQKVSMRNLPPRTIPTKIFIATLIVLMTILTFLIFRSARQGVAAMQEAVVPGSLTDIAVTRILSNDYEMIRPVIFEETSGQSPSFDKLKHHLETLLNEKMNAGVVLSADVFVRKLNDGRWMKFGSGNPYPAGSLMKVPIMMAWLKMAEKNPGMLGSRLFFETPPGEIPTQTWAGRSIVAGKDYRISELLEYLIVESDNNAAWLLTRKMDFSVFSKLFTDLGLREPGLSESGYSLSAQEYSRFMVVLYNSTYLSPAMSQYALRLLTRSTFARGITRNLPKGIMVAHKFGEQGQWPESDLSESAIVYGKEQPYLLTVMTHGPNLDALASLISEISDEVFHSLNP